MQVDLVEDLGMPCGGMHWEVEETSVGAVSVERGGGLGLQV